MNNIYKVMLYFANFEGRPWQAVLGARSAITAFHNARGWISPPWEAPQLVLFWRGLKKRCNNRPVGKQPLPRLLVKRLIDFWEVRGTPAALRNAFICICGFFGLRRISETLALKCQDVRDLGEGNGFTLFIERMKNDPFARGMEVPLPEISRDGIRIGVIFRKFLRIFAPHAAPCQAPLALATRGVQGFTNHPISKECFNKSLRTDLARVLQVLAQNPVEGAPRFAQDVSVYASHSLKKGGATAAAAAGMPQDCLNDLAGWNSPDSWLTYVKRPIEERRAWSARI
jgi:hypothetical protein